MKQLTKIEIMRDLITARGNDGYTVVDKGHYNGKLRELVAADQTQLAAFMLDENPNIRQAAKILFAEKEIDL